MEELLRAGVNLVFVDLSFIDLLFGAACRLLGAMLGVLVEIDVGKWFCDVVRGGKVPVKELGFYNFQVGNLDQGYRR